nr:hypothetical protein [Cytophagales bacterium]
MKVYKARRGIMMTSILLGFIVTPLVFYFFDPQPFSERLRMLIPLMAPAIFIIWPYFDTRYQIDGQRLKYKSAFIKGEIEISKIRTILTGKTRWVGIKPALATGGMIITYNRYDDVYLAPVDDETLIKDLLAINPSIEVIRRKK